MRCCAAWELVGTCFDHCLRAWSAKKPMLCLHAVADEDGHPMESEDESGVRLFWFKILRHVSKG